MLTYILYVVLLTEHLSLRSYKSKVASYVGRHCASRERERERPLVTRSVENHSVGKRKFGQCPLTQLPVK